MLGARSCTMLAVTRRMGWADLRWGRSHATEAESCMWSVLGRHRAWCEWYVTTSPPRQAASPAKMEVGSGKWGLAPPRLIRESQLFPTCPSQGTRSERKAHVLDKSTANRAITHSRVRFRPSTVHDASRTPAESSVRERGHVTPKWQEPPSPQVAPVPIESRHPLSTVLVGLSGARN